MKLYTGGKWFRGNLHAHTTLSDGALTPEESIARYRAGGYDFLCLTDHWTYCAGFHNGGFLVLPGAEYDVPPPDGAGALHIVGVGHGSDIPRSLNAQQIIDAVLSRGGLPILAHPAWSLMTEQAVHSVRGYAGLEVFNGVSEEFSARGTSDVLADALAARGHPFRLFASDDTHFYTKDIFSGFINVSCDELSAGAILAAIRAGSFYASQRPKIAQIECGGGTVRVDCSPARRVAFLSSLVFTPGRTVYGDGITSARYQAAPNERLVRVEITDSEGKKAWSQYFDPWG